MAAKNAGASASQLSDRRTNLNLLGALQATLIRVRRGIVWAAVTSAASIPCSAEGAIAVQLHQPEYISDVADERIIYSTQEWGALGINTAARPPHGSPAKLRIKDKCYHRGLGHHANGQIFVELAGQYKTFEADVGVQWQGGGVGSVVFQILVDDEKRFDSGVMRENDPPRKAHIPVEGAYDLCLVASDAGDGITCDCANWADARLIRSPSPVTKRGTATIDVAPFARVATWDPKRIHGTRAKRTEEFPAEDLFLASEVLASADGTFSVPVADNGAACIGLEWAERRLIRSLALQFADPRGAPPVENAKVQYWTGRSAWQGSWQPLDADVEAHKDRWTIRVNYLENPDARGGIQKIRWVFPARGEPAVLRALSAHTASPCDTAPLRVESERPMTGKTGVVEVYNGALMSPSAAGSPLRISWDLSAPLQLKVRYCKPRPWKTDRTVLRFRLPGAAFGVAVEDILANDCVYVPHAGAFVTHEHSPTTIAQHRSKARTRRTVLQRVREMPDQTFEQAWAKVHKPIQDNGPMMLSLACDNRKFVAHRDGAITFESYETPDQAVVRPRDYSCKLAPRFGSAGCKQLTRHLHGGWLPVPVTTWEEDGVTYRQRSLVVPYDNEPIPTAPDWLYPRALCVVEYTVENSSPRDARASLALSFFSDVKGNRLAELEQVEEGTIATKNGRLLAFVDAAGATPLRTKAQAGTLTLSGTLAPAKSIRCFAYLPAWPLSPDDYAVLEGRCEWLQNVEAYWRCVLAPAMHVELPDPFLTDVVRASQVHCLLAARNEDRGRRVAAWIASDRYGPLESEAHSVIRGMDMMGHHDFARRSLEFFVDRYNPAGYLTTGYTLMGTGWHLWTLAEHYERTQDREWLGRIAPEVARVCWWIARQCEKTRQLDAHGKKMPEYGLVPPGVAADWHRYAYGFVQQAHYYAGLQQAARALADIDHPEAPSLLEQAEQFRENILRAYRWTQARCPVLLLANGAWVPAYPGMLYCFGRVGDILPGEDGNRTWAYDVELGAHHLVVLGVLDPNSSDVAWITDSMEDVWFLHSGMGDYPEAESQRDFFNLGGFSKLQPYYTRITEVYALRDDVRPFIRSYFNAIPSLLSRETLSFWEHFRNVGAWNKTHETGYFLAQTRLMLVMERGEDLWLAPFVTNNWLKDGMKVVVRNAPTQFGRVSYTITSSTDRGYLEAVIDPPTQTPPKQLVIRLRHPDGKTIRAVTLNGKAHEAFDATKECVLIKPISETITVRALY